MFKIKIVFVIFIICFISKNSQAQKYQSNFGITLHANVATPLSDSEFKDLFNTIIGGGVQFIYNIDYRWGLNTDINYDILIPKKSSESNVTTIRYLNSKQFSAYINTHLKINTNQANTNFFINTGFGINVLSPGDTVFEAGSPGSVSTVLSNSNYLQFGIKVGGVVKINLNKNLFLSCDVNFYNLFENTHVLKTRTLTYSNTESVTSEYVNIESKRYLRLSIGLGHNF
jgi:hypothetical protein